MISAGLAPTFTGVPPRVVQNFLCSSTLVTLKWWWPYTIGPSLAATSWADAGEPAANTRTAEKKVETSVCLMRVTAFLIQSTPSAGSFTLDVFRQSTPGDRARDRALRRVHVALGVDRHALPRGSLRLIVRMRWYEGQDSVLLRAANADARLPVRVSSRARFRVDRIQRVGAVDEQAADPAELAPRVEEFAVLVEDLDAMVPAVGDDEASARIEGERVRRPELPGGRPELSPFLDVLPVLREPHDASVGVRRRILGLPTVSVRHEDVAIGRGNHVARL